MTGEGLGAATESKRSQDAPGPFGALGCRTGTGMAWGWGKSGASASSGVGSVGCVLLPAGLVGHCNDALGAFLLLVIGNRSCSRSSYLAGRAIN